MSKSAPMMVLLAVLAPEKEMADSQIFAGREKINWRIRNLSKKRIRFLKRANNQIEILKIIYYLFSIFKKKRVFQDWGLFLLKSTSSSKMVFKKKTALCSTHSNLKSNTDKLPDKRFVERFSTGPHSKPKKQPCQ